MGLGKVAGWVVVDVVVGVGLVLDEGGGVLVVEVVDVDVEPGEVDVGGGVVWFPCPGLVECVVCLGIMVGGPGRAFDDSAS